MHSQCAVQSKSGKHYSVPSLSVIPHLFGNDVTDLVSILQNDEVEVINFLLTTEIIPLCLRIMETGNELSKTVATFILQKILLDDSGLNYICQTYDRFSHVAMILGKMVLSLAKEPSARLLKHVVRCYLRLSDNSR